MARRRPDNRLPDLIEAGVRVFTERGYQRTQMADVAKAMGVAPGTLYLYVESKEALFHLLVERGWSSEPTSLPELPIRTPAPGATLQMLRRRLADGAALPALDKALASRRVPDPAAELEAILREFYDTVARNWRGIRLLEHSALDWPELAALFYTDMRRSILSRLTRYLERRIEQNHLRRVPDVAATARFINETVAWFAMHRHNDRDAKSISDELAATTVIDLLLHALLRR